MGEILEIVFNYPFAHTSNNLQIHLVGYYALENIVQYLPKITFVSRAVGVPTLLSTYNMFLAQL